MRLYDPKTFKRVDTAEDDVPAGLKKGLVPSVTEILSVIDGGEFLTRWYIKESVEHYIQTGDKDAAIAFRNTTSADFGSTCHELAEAYLNGTEPVVEHEQIHIDTVEPFFRWVDDYVESPIFTECFFASGELGYGGTADMLLMMKSGEVCLADLKFKKHSWKFPMKPSLSYKMQLSAYRNYFKEEFGRMRTANLLLASPFGRNKKPLSELKAQPLMKVFDYKYEDYSDYFECARKLWWAKHGGI